MLRATALAASLAAAVLLSACGGDARPVTAGAPGAALQCSGCHGDLASAARLGGAHASHVAAGFDCAECHAVPAELASPGHADGRIDVVLGERAGGAQARWEHETGSCAVACHGSLDGGPAPARPVWTSADGSAAACGACHGVPPPAPHVEGAGCASCHPATVGADGALLADGAHVNGHVDAVTGEAACGACHGIPPPAPHTTSTACGSCHGGYTATTVNATLHQNGVRDVTTAACGSCHGIPPATGEHAEHAEERISCGTCHPGASTTNGGTGHLDGVKNVSAPGWSATRRTCANACHGEEAW